MIESLIKGVKRIIPASWSAFALSFLVDGSAAVGGAKFATLLSVSRNNTKNPVHLLCLLICRRALRKSLNGLMVSFRGGRRDRASSMHTSILTSSCPYDCQGRF